LSPSVGVNEDPKKFNKCGSHKKVMCHSRELTALCSSESLLCYLLFTLSEKSTLQGECEPHFNVRVILEMVITALLGLLNCMWTEMRKIILFLLMGTDLHIYHKILFQMMTLLLCSNTLGGPLFAITVSSRHKSNCHGHIN